MHHHLLGKDPENLFSKYIIKVICSKTGELVIPADKAETKGKCSYLFLDLLDE